MTKQIYLTTTHMKHRERFHRRHAVLQHGRLIVQTDLDIQGSQVHHAHTRSLCA